MPDFKIGDVVKLRSGSPKMTIVEVTEVDKQVYTFWFCRKKKKYIGEQIHKDALEYVDGMN